ncbi:MAG: hypothetical protein J6B34_03980 [Clostridia bacterium]|nr:hypothetical protein [Clostridia bacterium]
MKTLYKIFAKIKIVLKSKAACYIITGLTIAFSILFGHLKRYTSYIRFKDSFVNLLNSLKSVFSSSRSESVILGNSPESYKRVASLLPYDFEWLLERLNTWWSRIISIDNLTEYTAFFMHHALLNFVNLIVFYCLWNAFLNIFDALFMNKRQYDVHKPTALLKLYILAVEIPFFKLLKYLKHLWSDYFSRWYFKIPLVLIWLVNLNCLSIVFEFFSWYFSFPFFISIDNFQVLLVKLLLDCALCLNSAPLYIWLVIAGAVIVYARKEIAVGKLDKLLNRVYCVIKSFPRAIMFYGTMGSEKTKTMSYWAFVMSIIYRDDSYNTLHRIQLNFPDFSFIEFENEIQIAIQNKKVKHLRSARRYVNDLKNKYKSGDFTMYGYQGPMCYDTGVRYRDIWEELSEYVQAYYIYTTSTSYILGNYPQRDQMYMKDGYFPILDKDFFRRTADDYQRVSKFSHIADYDIYRLYKRMNINCKDHFEFGISCRQENSKERGNVNTNVKYSVHSDECNPLNDGTGLHTRFKRHFATVDFIDYSCELTDDQRTMDLNAYEREPYFHVYLGEKTETVLAMPFFELEELIKKTYMKWFSDFYKEVRNLGKENTLPIHLMRRFASWFSRHYNRSYLNYGYHLVKLEYSEGIKDDRIKIIELPLIHKIVHGDLYATDSFRGFVDELMDKSERGLADFPEFSSFYPSIDENLKINSFLINELYRLIDADFEKKITGKGSTQTRKETSNKQRKIRIIRRD